MQLYLPKPITRTKLRIFLGKKYYRIKRYFRWYFYTNNFAKERQTQKKLPFLVKNHQSMLLRPLMGVDMKLQEQKITNLKLAADRINGLIIKPNQTFSFWFLVGKPTKKRGFLEGLVLEKGKTAVGIGGGLCQLANLLHWILLHSPLEITERWRHSYDVFPDAQRKVPFGSGATVAYNYIDLQFKNTTLQDFQLNFEINETHLKGELLTTIDLKENYQIKENKHFFRQEDWGGYSRHNELERILTDKETNQEIMREIIAQNHALLMYEPFLSHESVK
ncbi:VanW family protein [Bernardetia sp. Wsw4-3y2]|uniref:VanW family protein n=1 Tax=Bernardetia sp. Wsw4-3y2 TaxID=3127471 RepID=UPI0030D13E0F